MRFLKHPRVRFYWRVLQYFRADGSQIAVMVGLIGVSTLLGLLQVWPMAILVDAALSPTPEYPSWLSWLESAGVTENRMAVVISLALATLCFRIIQEGLNFWRSMLGLRINNNALLRVRCDLFRKLQALSLGYHRSQPQGDTIYRLSTDTVGCQAVLTVFIEVMVAVFTLTVMLGVMVSRSLPLTLIALGVVPILMCTNVIYGRALKNLRSGATECDSRFTSVLQRSMASITLMQAFGREAAEYGRFHNTVSSSNDAWYRFHRTFAWYRLSVALIFGIGGALIFSYGGYQVWHDQFASPGAAGGMTVGELVVFLSYLAMFYDPLCKITGASANVQSGAIGMERVFEILDRPPEVEDAPDAQPLPMQPRALSLDNVGFSYPSAKSHGSSNPVLRNIDVEIRPGQMVAFVGSSGVGKSTLLNLLPRWFDPTEGRLLLDGIDVRQVQLKDLRKHIAVVLQDSIIMPTTVAENIAYGMPEATYEQIRDAAQLAGADEFVMAMPEQYQTQISEAGQNLSGGQRQRLAIARALVTQAPFIVLDEPTSALDPHHERLVMETLRRLKGYRTMILVSHRLSTVVDCDCIYVMHEGRIIEQGTHAQLLARRGHYYEMARHQMQLDDGEQRTVTARTARPFAEAAY